MSGIIYALVLVVIYFPLGSMSVAATIDGMQLLGKGEAYYLKFIKVYDAALYSEQLIEGEDVLNRNISKCLLLQYAVDVKAGETDPLDEKLRNNLLTNVAQN